MLDLGPLLDPNGQSPCKIGDMPNFVDTMRRLHIPYDEEARRYFDAARSDGWFLDENDSCDPHAGYVPADHRAV